MKTTNKARAKTIAQQALLRLLVVLACPILFVVVTLLLAIAIPGVMCMAPFLEVRRNDAGAWCIVFDDEEISLK